MRGGSSAAMLDVDVAGRQGGAAVGAVGAHDGRGDGHLQGPGRVDLVDGVRGLDEDPVRVGRRAEVDLDPSLEAGDVAEQHRVGGALASRVPAAPGLGRSARTPRRCGRPRASARPAAARSAVSAAARS